MNLSIPRRSSRHVDSAIAHLPSVFGRSEAHSGAELGGESALIAVAQVEGDIGDGRVGFPEPFASCLNPTSPQKLFRREAGILFETTIEMPVGKSQFIGETRE